MFENNVGNETPIDNALEIRLMKDLYGPDAEPNEINKETVILMC